MIGSRTAAATAAMVVVMLAGAAEAQKPGAQTVPQAGDRADALLNAAVQSDPGSPPPVNDGEAYHRAPDSAQDPAELRTTQALNDEISAQNDLAESIERAEREKHEAAVAQSTADRLAYEESVRQSDAAQQRWRQEQAEWQANRARWEADVRACEAGDLTRCARPRQ